MQQEVGALALRIIHTEITTQYGFVRNTVKFQLVPVSYFFQFFN